MNDTTNEGAGWVLFAGIMLMIVSTLNIIWGIAAIDKANFFVEDERFIISDLSTWGWIVLGIGVLQMLAAFSIWSGGSYGRWVGIATGCAGALSALLTIPAYPFWALAIFGVNLLVVYGLAAYGGRHEVI
jgi:hypothetical protein